MDSNIVIQLRSAAETGHDSTGYVMEAAAIEIERLRLLAKRLANAVVTGQRWEGLICQAEDFLAHEVHGSTEPDR